MDLVSGCSTDTAVRNTSTRASGGRGESKVVEEGGGGREGDRREMEGGTEGSTGELGGTVPREQYNRLLALAQAHAKMHRKYKRQVAQMGGDKGEERSVRSSVLDSTKED